MKTIVDKETCIGCEICVNICPEVYKMENGISVVYTDPIPENLLDKCKEADISCPVNAISIVA